MEKQITQRSHVITRNPSPGVRTGNRLGKRFGRSVEIIGGVVVIGIGLQILITPLT
jgi:putative Mn2+ efflux pump MntP